MCILPAARDNNRAARRSSLPARAPGKVRRAALPEASGIAKSRRYPGIFWVHNDSGNPPAIFAIRRDGTIVREFRLGVPNIDWEDIAADDHGHLYVGDIGNNGGLLAVRAVYRIDEPDPGKPSGQPLRPSVSAVLWVFPGGTDLTPRAWFSRRAPIPRCLSPSGLTVARPSCSRSRLNPPAPLLRPASPRRVGTLPGFVEPATGASLSDDGQLLAVCSSAVTRVYRRKADLGWNLLAEVRYDSLADRRDHLGWTRPDPRERGSGHRSNSRGDMEASGARTDTARARLVRSLVESSGVLSAGQDRMSETQDVVIVGGGVIGLSIAYALAARRDHEHGPGSPRARPRGLVGRRRADRAHQ